MKNRLLIILITGVVCLMIQLLLPGHSIVAVEKEASYEEEKEDGVEKQMSSWWWSRAYPDPENINHKFYKAWKHAQVLKNPELHSSANNGNFTNNTNSFSGNWTAIGPDQNIGGRILCVAVDPQNSNNLFIGSASGGMWKSTTGGIGTKAWMPVITGFPLLGVASILIDPNDSKIMYAGTGEVYRTDTSNIGFNVWKARGTYGVGILKSVDGGIRWKQVLNKSYSNLFAIQMMEFDPLNSSIIYACATDGLYRSTDAGTTWIRILNKIYVSDVVINYNNPNLIVAAVGNLSNPDKGIYRTTNGGATWTKITSSKIPITFEGFIRLDNVKASPNMIIASVGRDAGSLNELVRSNDFGNNWGVLSNSNHCKYQFWFSHDVAINPSNTNQLMMAGVPLYKYTLSTAAAVSIYYVHADIHDIEYDPSNNNIVYVACDGGMYKSTNGGTSFSMINGGLQAVQFYASFAVSPSNPSIMIGGLQDNGVVRYNGTNWNSVAGGDGGPSVFHPSNPSIVFASNDARRLLRSTTGGTNFSEVLSSWAFKADSRTGFMAPVAISKSNPAVMYVASDNLHKSIASGVAGSWTGNSYTTANAYIESANKTGIALAVSATNANKLYVSTSPFAQYDNDANNIYVNTPPNLFRSINGGTTFTNIKSSLPDRFVMDFAISPTNDDSVWIVLGGFSTPHVFVTGNGGVSWTSKDFSLPDVPHNAILLDPVRPNTIYVGNDLGIYVSNDKGSTWFDFNNGLWDATMVMDLVATSSNKIVAATHGKGVFISDMTAARLPLTLVNFSGSHRDSYNHLQWITSNEENVSHFELERSIQGGTFLKIAEVSATNLTTGASYNYKDDISGIGIVDRIVYRLKITDRDGQYMYSNLVSIRIEVKNKLIVLNNPFSNNLKLQFTTPAKQNIDIDLFDAKGSWVMRKIISITPGTNIIEMSNLQQMPAGNYILKVHSSEEIFTRRVLKK